MVMFAKQVLFKGYLVLLLTWSMATLWINFTKGPNEVVPPQNLSMILKEKLNHLWQTAVPGIRRRRECVLWKPYSDIESFEHNAKVKLNTNDSSEEVSLTFQHEYYEWIITFPRKYPKEQAKISKKVAGATKLVGSLPEDLNALETVKQTCICSRCRARIKSSQRKTPSARYPTSPHFPIEADDRGKRKMSSANVTRTSPVTLCNPTNHKVKTPEDNLQWYLTNTGEKTLDRICTQISSLLLEGASVDISRTKVSGDIRLEFDYHRCRWRIEFPPNYPTKQPEIRYYDRFEHYTSINFKSSGIIWLAIKDNCSCHLCKRYTYTRVR